MCVTWRWVFTRVCACVSMCVWRAYLHVRGNWSAHVCSEAFPWTPQAACVCVCVSMESVCAKVFKRLVPSNTVYSVSSLCSSSCSWQSGWSVSWYRSRVESRLRKIHGEWRSVIRLGKTSGSVQSRVAIWFQQLVGEFLCSFSRWLGLRRCWRSCRWWVRRCRPGSRGPRCRRSGACGSSARTPPRLPPGTCGWPSARRSRRCETTGTGRAVAETQGFIFHLLRSVDCERNTFLPNYTVNCVQPQKWKRCGKTLSAESKM